MRYILLIFLSLLIVMIGPGAALSQRVSDGQQVLYGFQEEGGSTVADISGVGTPLNLTIDDPGLATWIPGGGLTFTGSNLLSSGTAATKIFNAVTASQELTVEAWVAPANTTQNGPARIVSFSADPYLRNFTLGQGSYRVGGDLFSMRMRTSSTGLNGEPDIITPLGSLNASLSHVIFTRDAAGATRFYVDGVLVASDTRGGDLSNWDPTYLLGLGNELTGDRPWLGSFFLVAVFDRALTGVEVQQNFIAGPSLTPQPPNIVTQPVNQTVYEGQSATFSVLATGTGPLSYQWQRDLVDIPGADASSYTTEPTIMADDGAMFRCVVTNGEGQAISDEALLTVEDYSGVIRIMPCGDSITYDNYSGDTRPEGERISYRYPLWQLLTNAGTSFEFVGSVYAGYDIIPDPQDAHNEGYPGWTDAQIAANIYGWLVANPADIVLLHIGTNGLNSDPGDVEDILDEIDRFEADSAMPVHVVLAKIINRISYSSTTTQFNTNIENMALARAGDLITIVDMEDGAGIIYDYPANGGDMIDNLHPTDDGYAKMAYVWYEALQAIVPDASLNCPGNINHYWMMEKEFAPYVNQFGTIARSTNPPSWTSGRVGYGQLFDYTNEVNVEDDDSLDWGPNDSFTMEFWMLKTNPVHGTATNNNEVILGRDDASTQQHWWLGVAATTSPPGTAMFQLRDNDFNGGAINSTTVVQDGEWHHVAAVRDGTAGINYLYVDGVEEASLAVAYPAGFSAFDVPMNVGWLDLSPGYFYDGVLDEVAFYSRALDAAEIADHYAAGSAGQGYCTGGETAPVITSDPVTHIYADEIYFYDVQAVGNPAPDFALLTGPAGMAIDPATGEIDWTPTGIGDFPVEVEASNSQGVDTQAFTLSVTTRPLCPEGMETYWMMDDATPGTYVDSYGGLDGQATVSPPAPFTPGIVGDCQDFNGTSDFITVADDPVLDWAADDNFTIELWFNLTNVASRNKVMIGRDQGGGYPHWWLGVNQDTGYANWNLLDVNRNGVAVTGTTSLNDGQWHHMVAVRDESLNQNRLYVDGDLVGTSFHDYTAGFEASTALGIGYMAYNYNPDYFYDGLLDEVALYSRALSEAEILDHWNSGAGKSYCSGDAEAPAIVSAPPTTGVVGAAYAYDVDATGNPAPTYSLNIYPAGMTIDPVSGLIDWTPTVAGDFDVEVEALNIVDSDTQFFTISVAEPDVCPADLNAYWKFDEDPGPPFIDWIGTADATCTTCPDPYPGLVGGAQWFDGTDEVNAPAAGIFDWDADASFTITYWMKTDQSTAGNRVLVGRDGDGLHMWVGCDDNGTVRFQLKENGGDFVYLGGIGPVLNDGQWHYVVAVRNNDLDHNAVYVDGGLVDEATHNYTVGFASSAMLNLGYLNLGGHYRYEGAMDDIAIFDRALDEMEIGQRYENGMANLDLCTAVAPIITSTPILVGDQGEPYSYDVDAVGNPIPTYSLTTAPAGMTIDPVTGVIDWVPTVFGPISVVVAATNTAGVTEQPFTIDVAEYLPFPDCMVSWWRLDETAGPPFIDLPAGYNGFAATGSPTPVVGKLGGAQLFDGLTQEVDVLDTDQYDWAGDASFTIELWMMTTSGGNNHVIVGRDGGGASNVHWWVGTLSDNTAYFGLRDSANQNIACASTVTVTNGDWHHIVAVRDGVLGENRIWVDGILENTVPNTYAGNFICDANLNIGYLNLSGHYRYPGAVDELAIYCRALEEAEILAHYNSGAGMEYSEPIEPVITSLAATSATIDQAYTYDVEATGVPTCGFALTTFPAGMVIDPATGIITWTPDTPGNFDVTVEASNTAGTVTQDYTVNVPLPSICPSGMTAYLKLNETSGTTYLDSYGSHSGYSPIPPTPVAGQVGGAQEFDGFGNTGTNEIRIPAHADFDWGAGDEFTIEFWMFLDAVPTQNDVIVGRDHDGAGNSLHWWAGVQANTGLPTWNQVDTTGDGAAVTGATNIANGAWHHLVYTRVAGDGNYIFVDGVQDGYTAKASYNAGFDSPTAEINIGWLWIDKKYTYDGIVDEVALYGRALTPAEIQQHFTDGLAGMGYCEESSYPLITSAAPTDAAVGLPYTYDVEATGNPAPTFALTEAPAGMDIDPASGVITFTPGNEGDYPVTVQAVNTWGTDEQDFILSSTYGPEPVIASISDIDYDEGGQIRLTWHRSLHDTSGSGIQITEYGIYRQQTEYPPPTAKAATGEGMLLVGWDFIATVPARGDDLYQFVAPTLCDISSIPGMPECPSTFFVSAMTPDPLVYFDSPPASGFSLDNLAPPAVAGFGVDYDLEGNQLAWDPSDAADFHAFLVYRDWNADFEPGPDNLVVSLRETSWFDDLEGEAGDPREAFYRIAAQDSAGNVGVPSEPGEVSSAEDRTLPTRFALYGNVPNPFNPLTTIKYDLPVATRVSLKIFDLSGRLVAVLKNNEFEEAGRHEVVWRGRNRAGQQVAAGVYFYRMEGGTFNQVKRMVLVK